MPGLAHARLMRSPYAHARIRSIDTAAARALPGVLAVVTADDLPDVHLEYGHAVADHPLIATDKVRYAGEVVVGVVAEDAVTADEALALVEVEYDPLPYVTTVDEALARARHHDPREARRAARPPRLRGGHHPRPPQRLLVLAARPWGDVDAAFAAAHLVVEGTYEYPMCYAFAMEPYTAVAAWAEGQLTVWSSAQHPYMVRDDLAHCFDLPLSAVRVIVPYVGGGYGSKSLHQDRAPDRGAGAACRPPGPPGAQRGGLDPHHPRRRRRASTCARRSRSDGLLLGRQASHPAQLRRLRGELAAGRAQGRQPAGRPVPDPGAGRRRARWSTPTPRRRPRSAASGRPR